MANAVQKHWKKYETYIQTNRRTENTTLLFILLSVGLKEDVGMITTYLVFGKYSEWKPFEGQNPT